MLFRYFQLGHAVTMQCHHGLSLSSHSLEELIKTEYLDEPPYSIYSELNLALGSRLNGLYWKWNRDLPSLTKKDWPECLDHFLMNMRSAREVYLA